MDVSRASIAVSQAFRAHGPYLSDLDEQAILNRLASDFDVADLGLRTCLCGVPLDGADALHAHLAAAVIASLNEVTQ